MGGRGGGGRDVGVLVAVVVSSGIAENGFDGVPAGKSDDDCRPLRSGVDKSKPNGVNGPGELIAESKGLFVIAFVDGVGGGGVNAKLIAEPGVPWEAVGGARGVDGTAMEPLRLGGSGGA